MIYNIHRVYGLILLGALFLFWTKKPHPSKALLNQAAPSLRGIRLDQSTFSLTQLKGKVVVLDVWATWCQPCRKSLPALNAVYRQFKNDSHVWIGSINQESIHPNRLKAFMKANHFDFPVIRDPRGRLSNQLKVSALPTLVVIDPQGKIDHVQVGLPTANRFKLIQHLTQLINQAKQKKTLLKD